MEIDFPLPAARVVQVLARLVECHGQPLQLRTNNCPEFISARLTEWCEKQDIPLHCI
jgi:putative transposase